MIHEEGRLLMTPGPTALPPDVREAMSRPISNPDVEVGFTAQYRSILEKLAAVYGTDDEVLVLGGEGILGLEASVASLIAPGEEVLCLANGLYGEGFADFVEMHGGEPVLHRVPSGTAFEVEAVASLVEERDFAAATMVHCETPTGVLNDLAEVLGLLRDAGVLTVVDAVSSLAGTAVSVDRIDVCLGASQKCLSSPPGLTTLSVSDRAWDEIDATEQHTFYTSLEPWRGIDLEGDEAVLLPYTHLVSNLYALEASLDRFLEEGRERVFERHEDVAELCRARGREIGLEPFPPSESACSPTVTAFAVDGRAVEIQGRLEREHDVVVATGLGDLADDVVRVGHMGYNADRERVERTMDALEAVVGS
ncbi:pyridoxal-phosphate-dependent aminotransferase family protein [Halomarina pelagica]|uniref:pyridoxal-phosphate-dependent aminotransferase family protein n=1 Tax=Halomarina pelagica TaxID=2961599 RepID=UPI0020C3C8B4|nr:alanine--glyoxylate aminotransferase family protein [Halomarina sp. BND7]